MKKILLVGILLLSACSPKNEQSPNFETKIEALATFEDTSTALADFGNPVTASTTRIFTFKNIGDTSGPGTASLTGTNSTSFSIILQTGCATVNVGSSCTVRVNFNPSGKAVGSYTADLNIGGTVLKTLTATVAAATTGGSTTGGSTGGTTGGTTSGGSGTIEATISGVAISNPLDYGSFTGTQTSTKIITLKNTGTTSTGPHTAALSDGDFTFTLNSCSNKTLAPAGSCSVRVTFNATSKTAQEYLTDLTFGTATFPLKATVAGSGTTTGGSTTGGTTSGGAAVISFLDGTTPISSPYSIGSTTTTSITKIITIKNTGTVSTGPHTAALSDTDITFTLNSCSSKTLAPNGSCTVRVTFNPTSKTPGEHGSTLTFGTGTIDLTATKSGAGAITYTSIYSPYSGCTVTQACQGNGIESRTLTACEQYTDGVLTNPTAPLSSCSTTALTRACQSPPGDVIVTTGLPTGYDSRSVTCTAGQTVAQGTVTDVTCSSTHFKTGTTCSPNVITYTAEYSDYGTCSVTEPCVGIGLETRTYSCRQYTNGAAGALLDSSNCSPSESLTRACNGPTGSVTITTGLPTGMDSRTILCLDGQTLAQGSVTAISCSSNYNQQGLSCILNQHSLAVSKTRSAGGTITSQPAGINCGGDCSFSFDYGTVVTLTQTVETGYLFSGWTGACTGTGTCSVNLDSNKTVGMTIDCAVGYHDEAGYCVEDAVIQYTLNVNNSPYGTITGDAPGTANDFVCDGTCTGVIKTLNTNDLVTLTFIPNNYYSFVSWGGNCASNPCVLNMNTNLIITPPTVDPILPSSLTLMINTGESTTTNSSATLNISAVDATEMAISTTTCDTSTNAAWEPYATTKAVTLVNGLNEFFVAFRNPAIAASSCAQASITLGTVTYQPVYSNYGTCSVTQPCEGEGIQTRTITSCNEYLNGNLVGGTLISNCAAHDIPVNTELLCLSPQGNTQVSITGGTQTFSCDEGSSTQNFVSVSCLGQNNSNGTGHHAQGQICVSNTLACTTEESNAVNASASTKTWNGSSSFSSCIVASASDCLGGYEFNAGTCSLPIQPGQDSQRACSTTLLAATDPNATAGIEPIYEGIESNECEITACANGYSLVANDCVGNNVNGVQFWDINKDKKINYFASTTNPSEFLCTAGGGITAIETTAYSVIGNLLEVYNSKSECQGNNRYLEYGYSSNYTYGMDFSNPDDCNAQGNNISWFSNGDPYCSDSQYTTKEDCEAFLNYWDWNGYCQGENIEYVWYCNLDSNDLLSQNVSCPESGMYNQSSGYNFHLRWSGGDTKSSGFFNGVSRFSGPQLFVHNNELFFGLNKLDLDNKILVNIDPDGIPLTSLEPNYKSFGICSQNEISQGSDCSSSELKDNVNTTINQFQKVGNEIYLQRASDFSIIRIDNQGQSHNLCIASSSILSTVFNNEFWFLDVGSKILYKANSLGCHNQANLSSLLNGKILTRQSKIIATNDYIWFAASDSSLGGEKYIYRTQGTLGTTFLVDSTNGVELSMLEIPIHLASKNLNSIVYIKNDPNLAGWENTPTEVWGVSGTGSPQLIVNGTSQLYYFYLIPDLTGYSDAIISKNDKAYFSYVDFIGGSFKRIVIQTDGTSAGTLDITPSGGVHPSDNHSYVSEGFIEVGNDLYAFFKQGSNNANPTVFKLVGNALVNQNVNFTAQGFDNIQLGHQGRKVRTNIVHDGKIFFTAIKNGYPIGNTFINGIFSYDVNTGLIKTEFVYNENSVDISSLGLDPDIVFDGSIIKHRAETFEIMNGYIIIPALNTFKGNNDTNPDVMLGNELIYKKLD